MQYEISEKLARDILEIMRDNAGVPAPDGPELPRLFLWIREKYPDVAADFPIHPWDLFERLAITDGLEPADGLEPGSTGGDFINLEVSGCWHCDECTRDVPIPGHTVKVVRGETGEMNFKCGICGHVQLAKISYEM